MPRSGSHLHGGGGTDSQTAPVREQTGTMSGEHATRLFTELRSAHWNQTETWRTGSTRLAAGSVRNTKDRDAPAQEIRAGKPGVGCTSRDAAGLSSTNRNRVRVARTSVEHGPVIPLFLDRG